MFIEGNLVSNKTNLLIEKFTELVNSGIETSEILVLVQNSTLKNSFITEVLDKLTVDCVEKLQIHSFYSLVYNTVSDNWAYNCNNFRRRCLCIDDVFYERSVYSCLFFET